MVRPAGRNSPLVAGELSGYLARLNSIAALAKLSGGKVGGYSLLEHTADVGISAYGDSLEDALSCLAAGMFSLLVDPNSVALGHAQVVSLASRDRETLAVDWLNELLYQYEATGFLMKECRIELNPGKAGAASFTLEAHCRGERFDAGKHHILGVIKAATYHQLSVTQDSLWRINVILDV